MDVEAKIIIRCPSCRQRLSLPKMGSSLLVRCPKCSHRFRYLFEQAVKSRSGFNQQKLFAFSKQWVAFPLALLAVIFLVWLLSRESSIEREIIPPAPSTARWATISYGHLIDHSVITHSGETVGGSRSTSATIRDGHSGSPVYFAKARTLIRTLPSPPTALSCADTKQLATTVVKGWC